VAYLKSYYLLRNTNYLKKQKETDIDYNNNTEDTKKTTKFMTKE
jgi:hypothetical protein